MAPENFQGIPYSYKVDIWSLGVLIVEIVSGKLPFTGDSPKEI
jgi:serine/threonine protein kinase